MDAETEVALVKKYMDEYMQMQKDLRETVFHTHYQYWDGIHKDTPIKICMGDTLNDFMKKVLIELSNVYKALIGAPVQGFLLVKGDYIISTHT